MNKIATFQYMAMDWANKEGIEPSGNLIVHLKLILLMLSDEYKTGSSTEKQHIGCKMAALSCLLRQLNNAGVE